MKRILSVAILSTALVIEAQQPLSLESAVTKAVERNERSAIAATDVTVAEARVGRARSIFLPQVGINGNYRNDSAADTRNTLSASANLTQPLFDARAFPLMRQARLSLDAARADASETVRLVAFDAANLFVGALASEAVLRAAENRRDYARASLEDVRARFEAGLVSSNDVTKAELEVATAERGVAQARGSSIESRLALANMIREDVSGPLVLPQQFLAAAAQAQTVDSESIRMAQQRRSDIAAQRARAGALAAFADEPSARFIPSLLLNAQSRNVNEGSISNRNNDGFVGVALSWPVFDAGLRRSDRIERTAETRGEELELELALRDVERQLRTASVQLGAEQEAARFAAGELAAARKNAEETNELYRQGLANALELLDANQRLFAAEVAEVSARYRMAAAYLALREARGEGAVE